jgi:hypothetical protein
MELERNKDGLMKYQIHLVVVSLISLLWAQNPQLSEPEDSPAIAAPDGLVTDWIIHHTPDGIHPILQRTVADAENNLYLLFWSNEWASHTGAQLGIFKYNASGSQIWDTYYPLERHQIVDPLGKGVSWAPLAIADQEGNLYISTIVLNDSTGYDIRSLKFYTTGQLAWERSFGGDSLDTPTAITLDGDSAFCIIGQSEGVDGYSDIVTIRYDSSGTLQWQARLDGPAFTFYIPSGIQVDATGSVVVFGYSYDVLHGEKVLLAKYGVGGDFLWMQQYQEDEEVWRTYSLRSDMAGSLPDFGMISVYSSMTVTVPCSGFAPRTIPVWPTLTSILVPGAIVSIHRGTAIWYSGCGARQR